MSFHFMFYLSFVTLQVPGLYNFVHVTGMFSIDITEDRNCELRLVKKIDHEKQQDYLLKLQLDTLAGLGNPGRTSTMVRLAMIT